MRRTVFVSMLLALFACSPALAQTGRITGTVISQEGGRPLSGATVSVVGTAARAVTQPDGTFSIGGIAPGTHQVTAQVLGHAPQTQTVVVGAGQSASVSFQLATTALAIEGVVAIGYGERRVRDVTGAVQAVGEEEFNTGRVVTPEQLIQGKVAGVQVVSSGEPGGGTAIRIRGGTSVNASNEPLVVVDGVPLAPGGGLSAGRNPLAFINPDDIARMTVLKDASSTAIYGSRGANGVIIVETKSGSRGPHFSYGNSFSTSRVVNEPDFLTAEQYRRVVQERFPNLMQYLGNENTRWRDLVVRNATGQEHSFSVASSGGASNYRLSLNYLDQDGVVQGSELQRYSGAFNYTQRLFEDRLTLRANMRGARTDDEFTPGGVLGAATVFDPTQPVRRADGSWFENTTFPLGPNNPLAELALVIDQGTTYRAVGNIEAQYRMPFLEALSATARLGYDVGKSERRVFVPSITQSQMEGDANLRGFLSRSNPTETTGVFDAFANYTSRLDRMNTEVDATVGYSYEKANGDYPYFEARGLETDLLGPNGVPDAFEVRPDLFVRESKLASFFGRVNLTANDRYLLTFSVRRDGSSRFGPGNQWGTFPAAALGWRIIDEPWFPQAGFLTDLKLRASWGVNGNQAFADYMWIPIYQQSDAFARVQFGNEFVTTIRPNAVDPNIKWEETTSYNLGADFGIFGGRVTGAFEYYRKDTDDLIFRVPVPAFTNLSDRVTTNIGSVRNEGVELTLNTQVLRGWRGITWDASFNASTNRNELLTINPLGSETDRILIGGIAGGVGNFIQVLQPGAPVGAFYVYRHIRENGRPVYADRDGNGTIDERDLYEDTNGDGVVNQNDRSPFKSPTPSWILAHTSGFGFRSLDLSFTMRAHLGNYVYNNQASSQGYYNVLNQAGGPQNLHASVLRNGFVTEQFFSDVYVEDASFLRMDNLTLGYTVPRVRGLESMRVFGTVQNVFTLTGYSGADPEAGLGGIDLNIYPRSRTFTAGVSVGF